ncbi:MAG: GPP34 family phosphoprotein [Bacteroidales bacterium]
MENFLTIPEEILLLSVSDSGGTIPAGKKSEVVLAASVLMDLAFRNRLDSDLDQLILVSDTPIGDVVLDEALQMIFAKSEKQDPAYWISQLALRSGEFAEYIVANLTVKKILKVENQKILWFFSKRKYPLLKDQEIKEVKERVREIVFSGDIPDIRDIVIISLLHYGGLQGLVFTDAELAEVEGRIEQIARMDLIGQAISKSLASIVATPFTSLAGQMFKAKTAEEKLELLVTEMKDKFSIDDPEDLPAWLRKGTAQYQKTLDFVREKGTADIYYHRIKDQYFLRTYGSHIHLFGGGA